MAGSQRSATLENECGKSEVLSVALATIVEDKQTIGDLAGRPGDQGAARPS